MQSLKAKRKSPIKKVRIGLRIGWEKYGIPAPILRYEANFIDIDPDKLREELQNIKGWKV